MFLRHTTENVTNMGEHKSAHEGERAVMMMAAEDEDKLADAEDDDVVDMGRMIASFVGCEDFYDRWPQDQRPNVVVCEHEPVVVIENAWMRERPDDECTEEDHAQHWPPVGFDPALLDEQESRQSCCKVLYLDIPAAKHGAWKEFLAQQRKTIVRDYASALLRVFPAFDRVDALDCIEKLGSEHSWYKRHKPFPLIPVFYSGDSLEFESQCLSPPNSGHITPVPLEFRDRHALRIGHVCYTERFPDELLPLHRLSEAMATPKFGSDPALNQAILAQTERFHASVAFVLQQIKLAAHG